MEYQAEFPNYNFKYLTAEFMQQFMVITDESVAATDGAGDKLHEFITENQLQFDPEYWCEACLQCTEYEALWALMGTAQGYGIEAVQALQAGVELARDYVATVEE